MLHKKQKKLAKIEEIAKKEAKEHKRRVEEAQFERLRKRKHVED